MRTLLLFLTLLVVVFVIEVKAETKSFGPSKTLKWKIKNTSWQPSDEIQFQSFIHTLGMARKKNVCTTLDQCLRSPVANPLYADKNPEGLTNIYSDCADLPFVLRAYFAWMNDLPFTFPTGLEAVVPDSPSTKNEGDIRYSKYGNIITEKYYVKKGDNINRILENIVDSISTGSFRTDPSKFDTGKNFRDTYSIDIDRNIIVPGTVVYDPNGHIALVYEVTNTGQIHMIDSHPDNTLTTITYGEKFPRSSQRVAGGFSRFRPFSIEGGITATPNAELPGYSLIQYQSGPFIYKDKVVSFYEYVRLKMSDGDIIYNPLSEFNDYLEEICLDVKYREDAVNIALKKGIDHQTHPETLPENIYGSEGDWEAYATPSRDARLKAIVKGTREYLAKVINGVSSKKIKIKYDGEDLVTDLRNLYVDKSSQCTVHPTESISLTMDQVLANLFDLSFDPYHCALLRWGIDNHSCGNANWYRAEAGLRNRIEIDYNLKTDYDVNSLPDSPASQMPRPDLNFHELLQMDEI
jgi:hypothetical protein